MPLHVYPTDLRDHAKLLFWVIAILSLLGMLLITLILMVWRRANERLARRRRPQSGEPPADAWKIAGQRMSTPPPEEDDDDKPEFHDDTNEE